MSQRQGRAKIAGAGLRPSGDFNHAMQRTNILAAI